jgi:4-amino-4-deoxy-L-arabinose transferase-like glycosyltransferase
MLWGGWLVVTWLTFSLAAGIIHPYYSVALAPAIGAVVAIGGQQLWQRRGRPWVPTLLAVILVGTGAWAWILLDRSSYYMPWLRWVVVAAAILAAVGVLRWESLGRPAVIAVLAAGLVATLGAPAIYSWQTTATPHSGALPTAGPRASVSTSATTATTTTATTNPSRQPGLGPLGAPSASGPGGLFPGLPVPSTSAMGSLLVAPRVDPQVAALLRPTGTSFTWVAATLGSENAAGFQLATGLPVLALGGFNASDPYPALADFQADVAAGRIHWFIGGGTTRPSSTGSDVAHRIAAWVVANYPEQVVDGVILYDLAPRG